MARAPLINQPKRREASTRDDLLVLMRQIDKGVIMSVTLVKDRQITVTVTQDRFGWVRTVHAVGRSIMLGCILSDYEDEDEDEDEDRSARGGTSLYAHSWIRSADDVVVPVSGWFTDIDSAVRWISAVAD